MGQSLSVGGDGGFGGKGSGCGKKLSISGNGWEDPLFTKKLQVLAGMAGFAVETLERARPRARCLYG